MSASKHFDKIAWAAIALVLVITVLFMNGAALGLEVMARTMGYENRLFDNTRMHTIDIVMNDWDEFIDNATSEQYYTANMVIDGEAYKNVAIRGKGNTSLSTVSSLGSERYSFKVEFDHYDSSVTYHGLDKLSLNNLIQDSTMMKDYLTYTMMNEFGAAAPLCSFVYITVNGEDWGLYLAVEGLEDSFLERNYSSNHGELYKPDSMSFGGGRGNGKDFNMDDFMNSNSDEAADDSGASGNTSGGMAVPDMGDFDPSAMFGGEMPDMGDFDPSAMFGGEMPDMGNFAPSQMPGMSGGDFETEDGDKASFGGGFNFGGMGGFGMGSSDVKLQYIDDNADSYSNIWNNAKTDITQTDKTRLIESLRKLSAGEDIESVVDMEQVIRYFVVHNYVCNGDSYTGAMVHNYYLYEENGQLAMLPWDYNLAYGTFQGGGGQSTVNTPIDAPVSGGTGSDRPMWSWILSDESYTEMYHQYYEEFLNTVDIQGIIDNAYNLIKSYVEKDPTAFYTYDEFEKGVETMRQFCSLRSESISMQLENGETVSDMGYVDGSSLTLSDMGSMGGGKGGFGGMRDMGGDRGSSGNRGTRPNSSKSDAAPKTAASPESDVTEATDLNVQNISAERISPGTFGSGMTQMPDMGELPEDFDPSQMQGGFSGQMPGGASVGTETIPSGDTDATDTADTSADTGTTGNNKRPSREDMQMPSGNFTSGLNGMSGSASNNSAIVWLAVSIAVLGAGLIIAKLYKY